MKDKLAHSSLKAFLNQEERALIERAVQEAEAKTSGEIRILVVERSKPLLSRLGPEAAVERRAEREFLKLGIGRTRNHTGVLIMISLRERRVCVKADQSIHQHVEPGTWQTTVDTIIKGIREGRQAAGICDAVGHIGELLARHCPRKADDRNELADGVAFKK